jgi:Zn-dependent peptidase ImmA (M78 family)
MKSVNELDSIAVLLRKQLGEDSNSPIDIFSIASAIEDLTIVYYPMGENISGMCIKGSKANLIAINSEMSLGRQRFSLAHEFYHLFYDPNKTSSVSGKSFDAREEREAEADIFASHFLLPSSALYEYIGQCAEVNKEQVVRLEQTFGLSRKAILYRLREESKIGNELFESMKSNVQSSAQCLGYDTLLYKPTPREQSMKTIGQYIRMANELYDKGLISTGKYEEFLLEAFREDIVYGTDDQGDEKLD